MRQWLFNEKPHRSFSKSFNKRLESNSHHFSDSLRNYHQLFIGTINEAHEPCFPTAVHTTNEAAQRLGIPSFDALGSLFYEKAASGDDPEAVALVWQLYNEILGSSVALAAEAQASQMYKDKLQSLKIELRCRTMEIQRLREVLESRENRSREFTQSRDSHDNYSPYPNSIMDQTSPVSSSTTLGRRTQSADQPNSRYLSSKSFSTFVNRLTRRKVRIYSEVDVVQPVWYPKSGGSVLTNGSIRTRYETGSIARFKVKLNPSTCDTVGQQTKEYRDWAVAKAERKYGELFEVV